MPIKLRTRPISIPGQKVIEAALNSFRIAVENFVREINKCPMIVGSIIEDQYYVSGIYHKVYHKLGREPRGWLLIKHTGNSYYTSDDVNDQYLSIRFFQNTTASIWFF